MLAAFWTGLTFIAYFAYAPQLVVDFFTGQAASAAYITVGILTLSTYAAAGLMREQICTYVCPYGRFQSVMYEARDAGRALRRPSAAKRRTAAPPRAPASGRWPSGRKRGWATASIAGCACRCARPASTSVTACNTSAFRAGCASMPAIPSWIRSVFRVA